MDNKKSEWTLIIKSNSKNHIMSDLWMFRDLFLALCKRDFNVRYKQTVLGILWAVIRPILIMLVFTIIFGNLANLPTDGAAPYAIMVYAATLPWQFFSTALETSSASLVGNSQLVSKVYFPRIIIPVSSMLVGVIDFLISFFVLLILMVYYDFYPDIKILFIPFFLLLSFLTALGIGLYITALNVRYRDFRYVIPFIIQFGLYISPVGFSSSIIPDEYQLIYNLNPMVGVIDGFRWCILGNESSFNLDGLLMSLFVMVFFLYLGFTTFKKMEHTFNDVI